MLACCTNLKLDPFKVASFQGVSSAAINDLQADGGSTLCLQYIPCQVLVGKVSLAPSVGILRTQLASRLQAPQAPACDRRVTLCSGLWHVAQQLGPCLCAVGSYSTSA